MSIGSSDILDFLDSEGIPYQYEGEKHLKIKGFCEVEHLEQHCVTWAANPELIHYDEAKRIKELLVVVSKEGFMGNEKINRIVCEDPRRVFFKILSHFFYKEPERKICQDSIVLTKNIGKNVSIGHQCFLNEEVEIGDHVSIGNHVSIECPAQIGNNTIIHSGTVIGTDGFGYFQENGKYQKIPHFGGVFIGKEVEIGANVCIDRGTLRDTYIGDRVKIDNLCHIAHNVKIMEDSMVVAMSLLCGSSLLKRETYVAPGAVIRNQVVVGEESLIGMGAVVTKDVEANSVMAGVPAKKLRKNIGKKE